MKIQSWRNFIQDFEWPTASGLNETTATEYCTDYLLNDPATTYCRNLSSAGFDNAVRSCILDIQVRNQMMW